MAGVSMSKSLNSIAGKSSSGEKGPKLAEMGELAMPSDLLGLVVDVGIVILAKRRSLVFGRIAVSPPAHGHHHPVPEWH